MSVQDLLLNLGDAVAHYFGMLDRNPLLRWTLVGLFWFLLMFRLFGRGTGQRHGLFNWYDWLVVAFGGALLWTLQFGRSAMW